MAKSLKNKNGATQFSVPRDVINNPDIAQQWVEEQVRLVSRQRGEPTSGAGGQCIYTLPWGDVLMSIPIRLAEKVDQRCRDFIREAKMDGNRISV